jgi:hypothetical protein
MINFPEEKLSFLSGLKKNGKKNGKNITFVQLFEQRK